MELMALPGLDRLMEVCQRLELGLRTSPPAREPLKAGDMLEGVPFDPVLGSVYARMGHAAFATNVMPVASNVDRFFDSYSRYLEALSSYPNSQRSGETERVFPWHATEILARDERLVELMRARRFDALMKHVKQSKATQRWFERVAGVPL